MPKPENRKPQADPEMAVLFPDVQVGAYVLKPWSFGRFKRVFPALSPLVPALMALGVTAANAETVLRERGLEVVAACLPAFSGLIARTLDLSEEEVDGLEFGEAAALGLTIVAQNIGRLKNYLPLIMEQIQAVTRGT